MTLSARFKRVSGTLSCFFGLVLFFGAASPIVSGEAIAAEKEELILVGHRSDGFGVKLVNSADHSRLVVDTGEAQPQYKVEHLSNPPRLVIDLPGASSGLSDRIEVVSNPYISNVRLGAHSDMQRVVLDLNGESVQQDVDVIDGRVVVTLSEQLQQQRDLPILAAPPVEEMNQGVSGMDADSAAALPTEELNPKLTQVEIEEVEPGMNQVIAHVSSAGVFNVKKTAPSEYVLTLEDATLSAQATNTVVAPPQSGMIRSVRAVQQGSDVLLRIFAQPGTLLQAKARSGKIYVTAAAGGDEYGSPMGQLGDDQATPVEDEIASLLEGEQRYTGRLISLDLQDTDIDNALRIIAEVSNLNIIASDDVTGKVTLRLIDVPWDQALDVILKTNGLDKVQELNVIRVAPVEKLRAEREALKEAEQAKELLEPLLVRYIRVSYARASEIKPLVETVLTERGSVATDERTNQIIIKDIQKGVTHVAELIKKLDLRTPQVLLETQIVEAQRTFLRDLGTELGFEYIQSPETGNALDYNFPNAVNVAGSVDPLGTTGSSFPAAITSSAGSAISALFSSADGTKSLDIRLTSLESEGRIRVVSRPSVATINNKPATIKSVEKIRVKLPSSGLSVATGQGATAAGGGNAATESFEVGITLDVMPQASPDYYVLLDINAKSSTLGATVVDGIPSEVERSATSSVLVSSGQTFALGGIYKITDNDSVDGVPFFKDIPVFGHLFRRQLVDNGDEELIFFITPRIVEGSFDDAAMRNS